MDDEQAERSRLMRKSIVPASLFTTEMLPPERRFDAWRESIAVVYDVTRPPGPVSTFNARVESYLFDDVVIARCQAGAQKFDRTPQRVASDAIDHYMIQLLLSGSVETSRGQRTPRHALVAFDFGETLDTFNSNFDLLAVIVPRRRLAPLLKRPDSIHETIIDGERGPGRLVADYLRAIFSEAPVLRQAEASAVVPPLLELIALAQNSTVSASGAPAELAAQGALMQAQAFIRDNLRNPGLDPQFVARHLGISRAQLYRLFAQAGGVSDYIREQRLRRCLADLLSARYAYRQVAEIALDWGFTDAGHFAKAFRRRYGRSPSDARVAMKSANGGLADVDPRVGDRLYEEWFAGLA